MTTWAIATNTLGEAMRKKVIQIFVLVAVIMIFLSQAFAFFASPDAGIGSQTVNGIAASQGNRVELVIVKSMALGVIVLSGLVMSIFLGMDLIPNEIERKTIYTILSKPVRRSAYLTGKQLGMAMTLGLNIGLMGLVFLGMIFFKTYRVPWEIIVGVLLIFIQFVMLGSVALFFSVFLSRNINAALTFFVFIVGMLGDFAQSIGNLSGRAGSHVIQILVRILHYIIPNFSDFNANNPLIHPEKLAETNLYQYAFVKAIPYGIAYSLVLLFLAIVVFDRKEM
jgi:ABC-type transport system involved in multi-copper enzyme maturation permease subunit